MGTNYADIILEKGIDLGVYTDSIDNRNSEFQRPTLKIINKFKALLNETFGKPKIKTKGYGGGQKYVTITSGDDDCIVEVNYWATTYKSIGTKSKTLPYTLNVTLEGECLNLKNNLDGIIEKTLKDLKTN